MGKTLRRRVYSLAQGGCSVTIGRFREHRPPNEIVSDAQLMSRDKHAECGLQGLIYGRGSITNNNNDNRCIAMTKAASAIRP